MMVPESRAANVASDAARKLILGNHAAIRYQLYQPNGSQTAKKIDVFMAPVVGAIKNGINAGLDPLQLKQLHDQALNYAITTATNLTPEQAMDASFSLMGDLASQP